MVPRPVIALPLVLTTVTTLAACAQPSPPGADPDAWPGGRTFLSTSISQNGVATPLVEGTRIELGFTEDGHVTVSAGCNQMGGTGRLRDSTLIVTDLWTTEMACPGGRMEQDSWVAGFIAGGPQLSLNGDELTLRGPSTTVVLLDRRVADPDRPLAGTRWVIDTVYDGESASSVPSAVPAVLVIERPGSFHATTGCAGGEVSGAASLDIDQVTFMVAAQQPCTDGGNALDAAVRSALTGERSVQITARRLRLMAPDGTGLGLIAES